MRAANVTWEGISVSDVNEMDFSPVEQATYELRTNDILLSEASGSASEVGKPAIWRGEIPGACFQNTLIRVRAHEQSLVPLLYWQFKWLALNGHFATGSRGTGIHHLGAKNMEAWPISLPPPGEEEGVVAAIEMHFSRLDAAVASLNRAKANVRRARTSIFQAAVEGRLVPTEAALARAYGRSFEPASSLLAHILAKRKAAWAPGRNYREPAVPAVETHPGKGLPEGWCWASMDALAEVIGGLTKDGKRASGRAVPYLRVANVQRGRLDLSVVKVILASEQQVATLKLRHGDVLLNEGGDRDKLGRGWVWSDELPECIHQNHVFRARLWTSAFDPRYLSHYTNTQGHHYFVREGKQTTNLASVSLSKVKALPVALPPAVEVQRILLEVDRRLSVLDALDAAVDANLARCGRLRQSILQRAFSGRLVPSDPATLAVDPPRTTIAESAPAHRRTARAV